MEEGEDGGREEVVSPASSPFFPFLLSSFLPFPKNDAITILRRYFIESLACGRLLSDIAIYGLGSGHGGGRKSGC
jgi:hypothetical protein